MFASFHSEGIIPSSNDKLNNFASGVLICSTISLSSFGGIPSTPGDLSSFNGTGSELIYSVVQTELIYGPTFSRTFCLLLT